MVLLGLIRALRDGINTGRVVIPKASCPSNAPRLRVIPRLSPERLTDLACHVVPVTILSVLLVIAGTAFRTGILY